MKYDIARLAKTPGRRGRVVMPPLSERLVTTRAYRTALRVMLNELARETREGIIPAYRIDTMTRDVGEETFERIRALAAVLTRTAQRTVARILDLEAKVHTKNFVAQAKKVLGIDIGAIVRDDDIADYLRNANARNTSLIKSLSDDVVKRVEQTVIKNQIEGNSVKTLRKALVEDFGIAGRRADLIAADQSAKLTSDLNRVRQEQAGIEKYEWATSEDERVRPLHRSIDGKEYRWGQATGAEGGAAPGQPIRCRCVARAIVSFDFD